MKHSSDASNQYFSVRVCQECGKFFETYGGNAALICEDCTMIRLGFSPEIIKTERIMKQIKEGDDND